MKLKMEKVINCECGMGDMLVCYPLSVFAFAKIGQMDKQTYQLLILKLSPCPTELWSDLAEKWRSFAKFSPTEKYFKLFHISLSNTW